MVTAAFRVWLLMCLLVMGLIGGGCQIGAIVGRAIPQSVHAQYSGLAGQEVAVMVWAPRAIRIDYPRLMPDIAEGIQNDLQEKARQKQKQELKGTTFPWQPRSVIRFQKEHPELEGAPITTYAHRISGISRLIYVEISDFSTRSDAAVQLLQGSISANVKVVEIADGSSRIAYENPSVQLTFPPRRPQGVINVPEEVIYSGTVRGLSRQVAELFYGHVIEE